MKISSVMTPCPYTIEGTASLEQAQKTMEQRGIRHLPVTSGSALIGVVTLRDVQVARLAASESKIALTVSEVCFQDPIIVSEDTSLADVAEKLAQTKQDCVLVSNKAGDFIGIFTTIDACRAIHLILSKA